MLYVTALFYFMEQFKKTINGIEFEFQGITEGPDEVCRVRAENQQFKMTTDDEGNWQILQQVPTWVKELEGALGDAIDEAYN
jgi:hypothetical protein